MIEVVRLLQTQGHEVDFYVRKDGGILVRRIDGEKFTTGASGNARARAIAGAQISEARLEQLKYATRARKVKKPNLDDAIYNEWKRVKKKWNRSFKAKGGKPHPAGYFGWNRIKYAVTHYGKEEALRRIQEAEKYASGIAYEKNVYKLSMEVESAGMKLNSPELMKLAKEIRENAYMIREESIAPAYEALYKLNAGESPKQVANVVRKILRLEYAN